MTPQDLVSFVKLVGKMYKLQQRFFNGDVTAFIQAKVFERKVDQVIANYNFQSQIAQVWEHRFIALVNETRTAQKKYFKSPNNLDKLRAREIEQRLGKALEWMKTNFPEGIDPDVVQTSMYD